MSAQVDLLLRGQDKQKTEEKKQSLMQPQCHLLGVWTAEWQDAHGRPQPPLCSCLLLVNLLRHYPDVVSRNGSTEKLGDLFDVTEKAGGKARNQIQLSWSQVNCISKLFFCFQCTWPFSHVIPHHGTNAIQLQSCNSDLFMAAWPFWFERWSRRG